MSVMVASLSLLELLFSSFCIIGDLAGMDMVRFVLGIAQSVSPAMAVV